MIEQLTLLDAFPVTALCDTLEVSRAGYYAWLEDVQTQREARDRELMPLVCDIFWQHKRRYGARRIAVELAARGHRCGVDRVAKLLKIQELEAIQPRGFQPRTTNSQHTLGYNPHLLLRSAPPVLLNRVWVADITYLPLKDGGFAYLASLMDLCSRRIVGWNLDDHMNVTNNNEIYSFHPGGSMNGFGDGSIRFLQESIDLRVIARMLTRNGGETIP